MTPRHDSDTAAALLEQAGWMRALARRLVKDVQRAEDLAQDTWVRALAHPPRTDQPLRGWLATVMRNALRQEHRGESRRTRRDARAAVSERDLEAEGLDLLERVTLQRELVAAVLELEEPYRRTLLMRYFEEFGPQRIAAETGVPVSTVKTRLARGLDRLRQRLDQEHGGDGRSWLRAVLPIAALPRGVTPTLPWSTVAPLGALAVNTKLVLAVVVLGIIGVSFAIFLRSEAPEAMRHVTAATAALDPLPVELEREETGLDRSRAGSSRAPTRAEVEVSRAPATRPTYAEPGADVVRGRVVDLSGRPVPGVDLRLAASGMEPHGSALAAETVGRSDPLGAFEVTLSGRGVLVVEDARTTTVLAGAQVSGATGKESIVVVAPRIALAGRVIDEHGQPVPDAHVTLVPPDDLRSRLGLVLDYSVEVPVRTLSDTNGWFDLPVVPALTDAVLEARCEGFQRVADRLPTVTHHDLVRVLVRPAIAGDLLTGVVVDESGFPVGGARVSMGVDTTASDDSGRFTFDLEDPESVNRSFSAFIDIELDTLLAVKPGYQPAELAATGHDDEGRPVWPTNVVLRLGDDLFAISGRVVDVENRPLADIRVWLADPTLLGGIRSEDGFPRFQHVENELAGSAPGWRWVESGPEGRFTLDGLVDREYELHAMDPTTLLRTEARDVRAGREHVTIVMPAGATYEVLRGRVTDRFRVPLEGVAVFPMCDAFRTRVQGQVIGTRHLTGTSVETDAQGRFELHDVPRDLVYLRLEHPDGIPLEWGRHVAGGLFTLVGEDHDKVEIVLPRRCHFDVELGDPEEADTIAVLDAAGSEMEISEFIGNGRREGLRQALVNGHSNPLGVGDAATTVVLYRADEEVRRIPLHLSPNKRTTVRP